MSESRRPYQGITPYDHKFYIEGNWVTPYAATPDRVNYLDVINPATEDSCGSVVLGSAHDIERAVAAARAVFPAFSATSIAERAKLLRKIAGLYKERSARIAAVVTEEMGAPRQMAENFQGAMAVRQFEDMAAALEDYPFAVREGSAWIMREPIGVCALITPWNAPVWQIATKVAPALAAGCTMVLKPSELAPFSALLFAEVLHDAGVPAGIFNLVNGDGATVGASLASHPDVDMVSITGSTGAGVAVALAAAPTVKRVHQELGGKSANIILDDADLEIAVKEGVAACFANSGQACSAPSRMIVPAKWHDEAVTIAARMASNIIVGDPKSPDTMMGPVANRRQYEKVQAMIRIGIAEGATVAAGGEGRPAGLMRGYYVRPTVFGRVTADMTIAQEEIFGPVLAIMPARNEEEAIAIANGTKYGLAAYVQSGNSERAWAVARRLRAGTVVVNQGPRDPAAPSGGYKFSGNGRQNGHHGLLEYLEIKAIHGL